MHFSRCGAKRPATTGRPQFIHSTSRRHRRRWRGASGRTRRPRPCSRPPRRPRLRRGGGGRPRAAQTRSSSSSASTLRSRPGRAMRWHSDATSATAQSRSSSKQLSASCRRREVYRSDRGSREIGSEIVRGRRGGVPGIEGSGERPWTTTCLSFPASGRFLTYSVLGRSRRVILCFGPGC